MLPENGLRAILIVVALSTFGCAGVPARLLPWAADEPRPLDLDSLEMGAVEPLPVGCPYAGVYLSVSTNGEVLDTQIAKEVRLAYSDHLREQGFEIVPSPQEAYWSAFSLVTMSREVSATFAWSVYMMATHDLTGRLHTPLRFATEGDERDDLSGFMLLKEVRIDDLGGQTRIAAQSTAGALLPHASRMCIVWTQDEELRDELAQEIQRVREERHRKSLQLDTDEPSDS